jgi:LmbE family N-acetylglucosaminyl deacetylase
MAYPDLLAKGYEPHKVNEVWLAGADDANYKSDITDTFSLKVEAVKCHKSQVEADFLARIDRLKARASAAAEGEEFFMAEAFRRVEIPW